MNAKKDHRISLGAAVEMTRRFRTNRPKGMPHYETFAKEAVARLLNTKGCESFRIFYGMKESGDVHAILVAVDANGQSILPVSSGSRNFSAEDEDEDETLILDDAWRCPPLCLDETLLSDD